MDTAKLLLFWARLAKQTPFSLVSLRLNWVLALPQNLKDHGKTVIVISNDDHFDGLADRIVKLTDGVLEYDGPASVLFEPSVRVASQEPGQSFSHA